MFPTRFFCARAFAPRYFAKVGSGSANGVRAYAAVSFAVINGATLSFALTTSATATES